MSLTSEVQSRWDSLTKPPGSLGKLEALVKRYALIRGEARPQLARKAMYIFCADHGVVQAGVSAFPQEVTRQMVRNFLNGGAAINVLCRRFGIDPVIVDAGVRGPTPDGVIDRKIAAGTQDFSERPAMTREQAQQSLEAGRELAAEAAGRFDIAGAGEMGIGNTTAASALLSAFTGLDPVDSVGSGTGVGSAGLTRKAEAVRRALTLHHPDPADGIGVLAAIGGFEIGAIAGFVLGAAERRLPVVLDGFISSSAALIVKAIEPAAIDSVIFSHRSAEQAHSRMLAYLNADAYYSLDMRLGEGTGSALTINLLESALALYDGMATFEEAGVSGRE